MCPLKVALPLLGLFVAVGNGLQQNFWCRLTKENAWKILLASIARPAYVPAYLSYREESLNYPYLVVRRRCTMVPYGTKIAKTWHDISLSIWGIRSSLVSVSRALYFFFPMAVGWSTGSPWLLSYFRFCIGTILYWYHKKKENFDAWPYFVVGDGSHDHKHEKIWDNT